MVEVGRRILGVFGAHVIVQVGGVRETASWTPAGREVEQPRESVAAYLVGTVEWNPL